MNDLIEQTAENTLPVFQGFCCVKQKHGGNMHGKRLLEKR